MLVPDVVYKYKGVNTGYVGYSMGSGFSEYMRSRVGPWHRDDDRKDQILLDVSNVGQGGFNPDALKAQVGYKPWGVGESLAECFLEDYRDVLILYNKIRDALNPFASRAGPDLVGITKDNLLAIGETKTSSEQKHPPGVVYGSSGMINQLICIATNRQLRNDVIQWLMLKIQSPDVRGAVLDKYFASKEKTFKIFGIMVRDTSPDERDVKKVHNDVANALAKSAFLDVVALYLPDKISKLSRIVRGAG